MKIRKVCSIFLLLAVIMTFALSSCTATKDETTTSVTYSYTPSSTNASEGAVSDPQEPLVINTSWQNNYSATYDYYNPQQSIEIVTVRETRNSVAFTAEYINSGAILYYRQNGEKTDSYTIIPEEDEQVHAVVNNSFSDLSSTFMKLTKVSANLPTLANVLYMYEENVAGRPCHKYIQRAYSGGELTESVYVWIDAEYGFAAKCEAYDASDKLTTMWETKLFSAGDIADDAINIDLSEYKIVEE